MNNYDYLESPSRNKTLIIVEGDLEKNTLLKMLLLSFPEISVKYENVYIYSSDVYDLYHAIEKEYEETWFEDDVSIDIPLLISRRQKINPQLDRRNFTNILLMFDYEHHDNWYSDEKIMKMQRHFNNASEDGLLYINYPMIESMYHFKKIPDSDYISRSVSVTCKPGKQYKKLVIAESAILDYLNLFNEIKAWFKERITTSDDIIESVTYKLLSSSSISEIDNAVKQIAFRFNLTEKETYNMTCALIKKLSQYPFVNKSISYWKDVRDLFIYIVKENVNKSCHIQELDKEGKLSEKDRYSGIVWSEVLEKQNKYCADDEKGIIFVLCTCITFLGEYKFCWV